MYIVMKKLLMIFVIGSLTVLPLFAAQKKEVFLRYGRQENVLRVVLESDDDSVKNAKITATLSNIKIEFPELFDLRKQNEFAFDTTVKDRLLSIALRNTEDVVFYKLGAPSRIVIDLKLSQERPDLLQKPTGEKAVQEQVKAAGQPVMPRVVLLDAGHGGYDYGIIAKEVKEKDLDLLFTKDLSAVLSKKGDKVFLTRRADQSLSILERVILANSRKPDVFISLHSSISNAFVVYTAVVDEPAAEASVRLYGLAGRQSRYLEKSRTLAQAIEKSLRESFKGEIISRELPLPILSSMDSPAVLIEFPSLQLNAYDQKMRDRFVNAIAKGLSPDE
jgi:N-acetylmuramoyl-L-alanine amidase